MMAWQRQSIPFALRVLDGLYGASIVNWRLHLFLDQHNLSKR